MKGIGIQLIDNADTGDLMDLKVLPMRNELGLISEGLVVGNILQQNKALILLGQPNDFKHDPTLGVGIEDGLGLLGFVVFHYHPLYTDLL